MQSQLHLRDTEEQAILRDCFRSSHLTRNNPTTACPCCLPDHKGKSAHFFERGTCHVRHTADNGFAWEEDLVAQRCNNCGYIRTSKPRKVSTEATKSQLRAMAKIQNHFKAELARIPNAPTELKTWEVTPDGRGGFWVSVETGGHILLTTGGHFHVGPHGSVKLHSVYDVVTGDHKKVRAELICLCTGAKLSKRF